LATLARASGLRRPLTAGETPIQAAQQLILRLGSHYPSQASAEVLFSLARQVRRRARGCGRP